MDAVSRKQRKGRQEDGHSLCRLVKKVQLRGAQANGIWLIAYGI
jgi:hypothetical protein